jgi:hypothetical protein
VITFVGVNRLVKAVVSSVAASPATTGQQRQKAFCTEPAKTGITSSEAEVCLSDWQLGEWPRETQDPGPGWEIAHDVGV